MNKNPMVVIKKNKVKMKCIRCGKCCEASPCFAIPFGSEIYDKNKKHICSYFSRDKRGLATCAIYNEVKTNGSPCTSNFKQLGKY